MGGAGAAFLILCAAECPAAERANRARRRDDDAAGESLRSKGATERREGATQAALLPFFAAPATGFQRWGEHDAALARMVAIRRPGWGEYDAGATPLLARSH